MERTNPPHRSPCQRSDRVFLMIFYSHYFFAYFDKSNENRAMHQISPIFSGPRPRDHYSKCFFRPEFFYKIFWRPGMTKSPSSKKNCRLAAKPLCRPAPMLLCCPAAGLLCCLAAMPLCRYAALLLCCFAARLRGCYAAN